MLLVISMVLIRARASISSRGWPLINVMVSANMFLQEYRDHAVKAHKMTVMASAMSIAVPARAYTSRKKYDSGFLCGGSPGGFSSASNFWPTPISPYVLLLYSKTSGSTLIAVWGKE